MTESRERWWDDAERDPIYASAVTWLARMQDPEVSLDDTLAWQQWIKESPRHAEAFARLEEVSAAARAVWPPQEPSVWDKAKDRYDGSVPISDWQRPRRSTLAISLAASVAMVLMAGVLAWKFAPESLRSGATVLTTQVGENRTVSLKDGSRVTLGGNSSVTVSFSAHVRNIELSKGEAYFSVAKDKTRPFRVSAGNATVTAVGTQFNVRRASDRAVVAVTEGSVVVEPLTRLVPVALLREFKPKLRPVHVDAGQQTIAGRAGIEAASKVVDPSATTSWQTGQLAFRLQPLKYVLEDVNRYAPKPIVLEDDSIGSLLITGTVADGNVSGWIGSLERAFSLMAIEEQDRVVIRRK